MRICLTFRHYLLMNIHIYIHTCMHTYRHCVIENICVWISTADTIVSHGTLTVLYIVLDCFVYLVISKYRWNLYTGNNLSNAQMLFFKFLVHRLVQHITAYFNCYKGDIVLLSLTLYEFRIIYAYKWNYALLSSDF